LERQSDPAEHIGTRRQIHRLYRWHHPQLGVVPHAAASRKILLAILAAVGAAFALVVIPSAGAHRAAARGPVTLTATKASAIARQPSAADPGPALAYLGRCGREIGGRAIVAQTHPAQITHASARRDH
jgi:hypothetical protein